MRSNKTLAAQGEAPHRRETAPDLRGSVTSSNGSRRRGTTPDLGGGGGGGGSGGGGGGGGGEGGRLSFGTAINQLEVLKALTGMSDEELQWLMDSKAGNAFLIAEKKKTAAETA